MQASYKVSTRTPEPRRPSIGLRNPWRNFSQRPRKQAYKK